MHKTKVTTTYSSLMLAFRIVLIHTESLFLTLEESLQQNSDGLGFRLQVSINYYHGFITDKQRNG